MGFYRRHVAPRIIDTVCSPAALSAWRGRCVEDVHGRVIEIGFGAGRNLPLYPEGVTELTAIEPSSVMRQRAQSRIDAASFPVLWGGLDGQHLDVPDDAFDYAVVAFSLCTIPDPDLAARELRRVVRDGGELRLLEHGRAPDENVARWQQRLDPIERRLADGCHLTRDPVAIVTNAGWNITNTFQRYTPGPKPWTYFSSLRAR